MVVKMHIFREFLLDHEDLVSGMSFKQLQNICEKPLSHTTKRTLRSDRGSSKLC